MEEVDSLQRSKKKCKTQDEIPSNEIPEEIMTEAPKEPRAEKPSSSTSFKDALMKRYPNSNLDTKSGEPVTLTADSSIKPPGSVIPIIPVSKEELSDWAKPWQNTLIVKVLGKNVNYRLLENKHRREWVHHGKMKITDLAEDFYLAHLSSIEDYKHALFDGP